MNNKGFSLIETILYTTLLSFIMLGIFSTIISNLQYQINFKPFSNNDYLELIKNYHEK